MSHASVSPVALAYGDDPYATIASARSMSGQQQSISASTSSGHSASTLLDSDETLLAATAAQHVPLHDNTSASDSAEPSTHSGDTIDHHALLVHGDAAHSAASAADGGPIDDRMAAKRRSRGRASTVAVGSLQGMHMPASTLLSSDNHAPVANNVLAGSLDSSHSSGTRRPLSFSPHFRYPHRSRRHTSATATAAAATTEFSASAANRYYHHSMTADASSPLSSQSTSPATSFIDHEATARQPLMRSAAPSTVSTGTSTYASAHDNDKKFAGRIMLQDHDNNATAPANAAAFADTRLALSSDSDDAAHPSMAHSTRRSCDHRSSASLDLLRQQRILLSEDDLELVVSSYRFDRTRLFLYRLGCCFTVGLLYLLTRWLPRIWIRLVGRPSSLGDAEWVVVENQWHQLAVEPVRRYPYGGRMANVFSTLDDGEKLGNETLHTISYFDHRYTRYIYHPRRKQFVLSSAWQDATWRDVSACSRGLSHTTHTERLAIFGANLVDIERKSVSQLLVDEVLHPFYIFQIFSVILWCFDSYYYYASCIVVISAFSIVQTLLETRRNVDRMQQMARFLCSVRVFRDGHWQELRSDDLVPGDLVDISQTQTYPCDMLLLSGDCIVNESMLTGESVPVSKTPCSDDVMRLYQPTASTMSAELARHFLFGGTKAVRVRPGNEGWQGQDIAVAMVVRTGFNSTKGALVRSVLYPRPNRFKFYRDSFRFIAVLAGVAVVGFAASVANFIALGLSVHKMVLRALDLVTVVVPPALPATLAIGTSFAIHRMRKANIYCISPPRVNVAGKINMMCFDKTGTLTEDGLDVLGVRAVEATAVHQHTFAELKTTCGGLRDLSIPARHHNDGLSMLHALTTCHSLKLVNQELIGDPLDLKMFDFTDWTLEESGMASRGAPRALANNEAPAAFGGIVPTVVRPPGASAIDLNALLQQHSMSDAVDAQQASTTAGTGESITDAVPLELGILRCFEFLPALRRMSVLVKQLGSHNTVVYVKGAPEVMRDICRAETIPDNFERLLADYTHQGYRVIACAGKNLNTISWVKAQRMSREQAECELDFLGFIVFENKLKEVTAGVIGLLHDAKIRQVMCTGDNVLTAISVSRACGLVATDAQVYVPRLIKHSAMQGSLRTAVEWENVDSPDYRLDPYSLRVLPPPYEAAMEPNKALDRPRYDPNTHYELAVTGEVFRWMVDHAPVDVLHRMLVKSPIFARMSPDEKQELVMKLQELGYCVGFCGDGANDCGALRAADVGVSLSEEEASVAAPFTSSVTDIRCVVKVIREGRAALVTSFSCFKFMALYSMIQFVTIALLYTFAYQLADLQYLFIDLFIIMPVAVSMGRTRSFPTLSIRRPTASLVSKKVLASIGGQIIVQAGFQLLIYFLTQQQSWYVVPPPPDPDEENVLAYVNSSLFSLSCFQYLFVAAVFSVGRPFRRPMYSNAWFVGSMAVLFGISVYLTAFPSDTVREWMLMMPLPMSFARIILLVMLAMLVATFIVELYIAPWIAQLIKQLQARVRRIRGQSGKRATKPYKLALAAFR